MICIGQDQRGTDALDLRRRQGLDDCLCANGCKYRRQHIAMGRREDARAHVAALGGDRERKHRRNYTVFEIRQFRSDGASSKQRTWKATALSGRRNDGQ